MRGRNVDSHRLHSVVVARDWWLKVNSREDRVEIIEEMALPKRCANNEIALKKINFQFLDKYANVYFHDGPPTKRRTTKRHNRRLSAQMLHSVPAVYSTATSRPQTLTSRRRSFSRMNLDSEPKKICVILEVGLRAQNRTPFRGPHQLHVPDALPGSETPRSGTLLSSRETSTT
ncbi:uncharacterized protein LOC128092528 [Culex pipiens pallens]|uniref:uncharacterized protein LOC128092528 n=1 Tax=Culex pipiens pallens TaxID=42434 RepID=UPI0022AAF2EF|nr:uncharacterized protein LOC128092528 [Culex pipiens pallens]